MLKCSSKTNAYIYILVLFVPTCDDMFFLFEKHEMILAETENLQKREIQLEQENACLRAKVININNYLISASNLEIQQLMQINEACMYLSIYLSRYKKTRSSSN